MAIVKPVYYKDNKGEWRWRITANNHRRTHSSTEGFSSKGKAKENFQLLLDAALAASGAIVTEPGPLYE